MLLLIVMTILWTVFPIPTLACYNGATDLAKVVQTQ